MSDSTVPAKCPMPPWINMRTQVVTQVFDLIVPNGTDLFEVCLFPSRSTFDQMCFEREPFELPATFFAGHPSEQNPGKFRLYACDGQEWLPLLNPTDEKPFHQPVQ